MGAPTVRVLEEAGHEPVVLARSRGVDILTGRGLDPALAEVDVVVDVSNVTTLSRRRSVEFFTTGTTHLLEAGARAGVRHHVVLSIVGVDRVGLGYYEGKRRQEEIVRSGPVPSTVIRATQFHEFAEQVLTRSPGPVALVPRMRVQPVAAAEVAAVLAEVVAGPPSESPLELAGPQVHELVDLARRVAARTGSGRRVVGVRIPGRAGRAVATGALLPTGAVRSGATTFEQWLAGRP